MPNVFLISDTHFGHAGVCKFLRDDGTKLRPWDTPEEMDEALVERWNSVVKPEDKVYHLGDVVIARKNLVTLSRLNGKKSLIKGNHDIFRLEDYTKYFYDVRGSHKLDSFILTHIPIHPESLSRWTDGNIHGHLHSNRVKLPPVMDIAGNIDYNVIDERYINVSVEQIDYTPIEFTVLRDKYAGRYSK